MQDVYSGGVGSVENKLEKNSDMNNSDDKYPEYSGEL